MFGFGFIWFWLDLWLFGLVGCLAGSGCGFVIWLFEFRLGWIWNGIRWQLEDFVRVVSLIVSDFWVCICILVLFCCCLLLDVVRVLMVLCGCLFWVLFCCLFGIAGCGWR